MRIEGRGQEYNRSQMIRIKWRGEDKNIIEQNKGRG